MVRVLAIDTPFRLLRIFRKPGNILLSSIFNTIWVIIILFYSAKIRRISDITNNTAEKFENQSHTKHSVREKQCHQCNLLIKIINENLDKNLNIF